MQAPGDSRAERGAGDADLAEPAPGLTGQPPVITIERVVQVMGRAGDHT